MNAMITITTGQVFHAQSNINRHVTVTAILPAPKMPAGYRSERTIEYREVGCTSTWEAYESDFLNCYAFTR